MMGWVLVVCAVRAMCKLDVHDGGATLQHQVVFVALQTLLATC